MLHVHIGETVVCVVFGIVKKVAVPFLLSTAFIDQFMKGIFSVERTLVVYNAQAASILMVHDASINNHARTGTRNVAGGSVLYVETEEQEHVMRVATATTLQPISETPVLFNTSASKIVQIDSYRPFRQQFPCFVARGMVHVFPGRSFRILTANVSSFVINLAKYQWVAVACPPFLEMFHNIKGEPPSYSVSTLPTYPSTSCTISRHQSTSNRCFDTTLSRKMTMTPSTTIGERKWRLQTNTKITDRNSWAY